MGSLGLEIGRGLFPAAALARDKRGDQPHSIKAAAYANDANGTMRAPGGERECATPTRALKASRRDIG